VKYVGMSGSALGLAEAGNAHWELTGEDAHVEVLRKAKRKGAAGNTEYALGEIEEYQRKIRNSWATG
jgi:hypothetical protein